jgi:hypothetical protein
MGLVQLTQDCFGTSNQVLSADSTQATGLGGSLQLVVEM